MFERLNLAEHLLDHNLRSRRDRIAFIDDQGSCSFADLDRKAGAFAGYLRSLGLAVETRILLALEDSIAFPVACLGAIKAGLVPVMVNPLLPPDDLAYMLDDSRARLLVASQSVWPRLAPIVASRPFLDFALIDDDDIPSRTVRLTDALDYEHPLLEAVSTRGDEPCLWQYSSGSTGRPKGTIHSHAGVAALTELYPQKILRLTHEDVTFSAAKLFFGYGFGNGLVFPLSVGATAILMAERPTASAVWDRLRRYRPTIFYGVPTLYNSMVSTLDAPASEALTLRICTSAGEALPPDVARRWQDRFGVPILNGMGSTEMGHIFLSDRFDDVAYGANGRPVDGYELRLLDEDGHAVARGEVGELHVKGPSSAIGYWCNREKTAATFLGAWVRTGDRFCQTEDDRYIYHGRRDDMLKVSGIYVSPLEVEAALQAHPIVEEAAVVGFADDAGLIKPKAFVVLRDGANVSKAAVDLKAHVKALLAPHKYPRWFEFVNALPKTVTGKVERHRLREPH